MSRQNMGGHIRTLGGKTKYRLIRMMIDGVSKQVLEHRYVMEQSLGRKLKTCEIIHHIDGDGLNNSIDNLELMSQSDHQNEHLMTGPHKWPLDEAVALNNEGWTLAAIGEKFGVSYTSIRKAFLLRGIPTINKSWGKLKTPKWDIEKAISLLSSGMPLEKVGVELGVTGTAIRTGLKKRGLYRTGAR